MRPQLRVVSVFAALLVFGCSGSPGPGTNTKEDLDSDGDGFAASVDCADDDAAVNPDKAEVCNGVDDDCDGQVDEGLRSSYYVDADSDGYGVAAGAIQACSAPAGYVTNFNDCNDAAGEVHPGASESCNEADDDCDGQIDEGVKTTFYADADSDGFGLLASTTEACSAPTGYIATGGDCDDASATTHPGATESCNAVDDDCDGQIDEGVKTTFYADADGDAFGLTSSTTQACVAPSGYTSAGGDCDDASATTHPGATESCNTVDDDCDGQIDEGVQTTYYADTDGDGVGRATTSTLACSLPNGFSAASGDCNDANAAIHPGASETCNSADDDCDGQIDEGATATWYLDADGDGYGSAATNSQSCAPPVGYVAVSGDCDDTAAAAHPGANEVYDAADNDCDGTVNEGLYPKDCRELKQVFPSTVSGAYSVDPDLGGSFSVWCDMTTFGGGWTVFQRRVDNSVDFYRTYADYTNGFGTPSGNFWLGLAKLRRLTAALTVGLRVELTPNDAPPGDFVRAASYNSFSVGTAASGYVLTLSGFTDYNGIGDSLTYHSGKAFSTYDGGPFPTCATSYKGGWWYGGCLTSNLNGLYLPGSGTNYGTPMVWQSFRGYYEGMKKTELKLRADVTTQ